MRVYTCTPVAFEGDERFFTRDSGLFNKGLLRLGIESVPILAEPSWTTDKSELLRVPYTKLEDHLFWRSLDLDGLVLYSWAAPRYLKIARAIRKAGVPFLVNVDSCGIVSRAACPRGWWRDLLPYLCVKSRSPREVAQLLSGIADNLGIHRIARGRLATYELATVTCAVSPMAQLWLQNEAIHFGKSHLLPKINYLPHPQMQMFSYNGERKENLVLSVARWEREDWAQKNPKVLLEALEKFLTSEPDWRACVVGSGASRLAANLRKPWLMNNDRCEFIDFIKPEELVPFYQKAKIGVWSSRSEGQIGTGAQALCCGFSVVAGNAGTLSCFHHYVSRESGRLALGMDSNALCEALKLEADAWVRGQRDPERISRIWTDEFHEVNVASQALTFLGLRP